MMLFSYLTCVGFAGIPLSMDNKTKAMFLKLVRELEDLRANLLMLTQIVAPPTSHADAQDAKNAALEINREHYEALRKEIDAL